MSRRAVSSKEAQPEEEGYVTSLVDSSLNQTVIRNDEDDFKLLRHRKINEMFDRDFQDFCQWMRKTYGSKYTLPVMRQLNRRMTLELLLYLSISLLIYLLLRIYFYQYVSLWFLPMFLFSLLYVMPKEEIVHMRAHWCTNMTGSDFMDKCIDWTMMIICGGSKESFRRRHIAAHYADVANFARIFSDVWLPFITLPPVFYIRPHLLLRLVIDKEFCAREKLNRTQLFIEMIGLYLYISALFAEMIYLRSFWLICFHFCPMMFSHASQFLAASVCHSGVDKRNSFNSNGLFDPDTIPDSQALFRLTVRIITRISDGGLINHGIHHAFTQLPLPIVNKEYKKINKHILETYKNVRYNQVLSQIVQKQLFARIPAPKWYDYVIQGFLTLVIIFMTCLTVLGLPVPPTIFEACLVDYRIFFYSSRAERYANQIGFLDAMEMVARKHELVNPNAYFVLVLKNYEKMLDYLKKYAPDIPIPKIYDKLASEEVMTFNVKQRGKAL
jgi:hypothetical protein